VPSVARFKNETEDATNYSLDLKGRRSIGKGYFPGLGEFYFDRKLMTAETEGKKIFRPIYTICVYACVCVCVCVHVCVYVCVRLALRLLRKPFVYIYKRSETACQRQLRKNEMKTSIELVEITYMFNTFKQ